MTLWTIFKTSLYFVISALKIFATPPLELISSAVCSASFEELLKFKNIYGLYEKLTSKLYVSSGSGCWGPKMRLGTKNEVVDILISKN